MLVKNGKRFRYYLSLENRQFSNEWRDNSNQTLHVLMAWGCCLSFIQAFGDASNEGEYSSHAFSYPVMNYSVKPDEQSQACLSYAMAKNSLM